MSRFQAHASHSRNLRDSSPRADDYHTGVSSIDMEQALHSTQPIEFTEQDRERWPSQWNKAMDRRGSEGSEGSASMSIELGRGLKRAGEELNDQSSNAVFTFGDDSQYELTTTPPLKNMTKKSDNLRRDISIRKANEGAKRTVSRTVSGQKTEPISLQTRLANNKNTRFTKPIAQSRAAQVNNDTYDTYDIPNISGVKELIDPSLTSRSISFKNRSRFTPSATHRMPVRFEGPERVPVQSVPIPEDEKKIYAALQALQEKVNQLEDEHEAMHKQLDQYEKENIQLRNALAREEQLRRPDSALGSEDETAKERWRMQRTQLQTNVLTLKQQLAKSEQKVKARDEDLRRASQEKQDLITQLGVECYRVQEIESENMALREDNRKLRAEADTLRGQLYNARMPTQRSLADDMVANRALPKQRGIRPAPEHAQEIKAPEATINFEILDAQSRHNIAEAVKQQVVEQRQRRPQSNGVRSSMFDLDSRPRQTRNTTVHSQQHHEDNDEAYTEFEMTKNTTQNLSRRSMQDLVDNITELSLNEPRETEEIRQHLESMRRAGHLRRQSAAPVEAESTLPKTARRSSLRDPAELNAHKEARTVRVQSPPVDDLTEASLPARQDHEDGMTSEFLMPDITMNHRALQADIQEHNQLKHDAAACTVCNHTDLNNTSAPPLRKVSSRTDLPEDATARPSQPPQQALSAVLRQLNDELDHLKLVLAKYQLQHAQNDPSVGARGRTYLHNKIRETMAEAKRKEDQIYALWDAVEDQEDVEELKTVHKEKVKPVKPTTTMGYDGAYDAVSDEESVGLPAWEGLSDDGH